VTLLGVSIDTILTAASILVAMAGWLIAAREQRRQARKSHTFNILLSTDTTSDLGSALDEVDNRALKGPPLTREAIAAVDPPLRRAMNFFEFLCAAVRNHTLDEDMVRTTLRTRILRLYDYTRELTAEIRVRRNSPAAMEHLEWFALRRLDYSGWKQSSVTSKAP
jgi:hypothetical protein